MAVLKKIRSRLFSSGAGEGEDAGADGAVRAARGQSRYDVRPLTVAQLDECWRLDLRCFVDGEAYSRETFEYLLTSPDSVSYRAVTPDGTMVGFIVGIVEPDRTGHITTLGVAPEHRNKGLELLMIHELYGRAMAKGYRACEASWTLEDNRAMNHVIEAGGAKHYKTYRIYEKDL